MKNTFRLLFIALAFATTGLFAQAATEPVAATTRSHQHSTKIAKKGHKKHKKHRK
jgi:hypothetical protein